MSIDIIMFCFDDRWQDWEKSGFINRSPILARSLHASEQVRHMIIVGASTSFPRGAYRYLLKHAEIGGRVLERHGAQFYFTERIGTIFTVEQLRFFPRESSTPLSYKLNCIAHDRGLIGYIKSRVKELGMQDTVLWLNNPLAARFIGKFDEKLSVYNAVDDWPLHPRFALMRQSFEQNINRIREEADAIFAVSDRLVDKLNGSKAKAFLIPNGVDLDGYMQVDTRVPEDLACINSPRVGYVGVMQERFDTDLFRTVVEQTPDISYILIGPLFSPTHFTALKAYSNVHFLGSRNKRDIPAYIKGFDACVMPHRIDDFTKAMNPIKLYEYLAAGKPVISTPIPGLDAFNGFVEFAGDANCFIRKIKTALSADQADRIPARIEFAKENSWSSRIENIAAIIHRLMG
ncbi:MAG: glycosyltransferase [Candidatus Aquicultor sp.]